MMRCIPIYKTSIAFFITFFLSISSFVYAQKEANVWCFGKKAGVDFGLSPPLALNTSQINTEEGCASICDQNGRLLFYTDGISVWNKDNVLMQNGQDLKGHSSSTQSGVAIQKPGQKNIYYLFTVTSVAEADGFCYSVIDMDKQNGLGEVLLAEKNIVLHSPVTEKLTAVKHRNGIDVWVLVHEWNSNVFLAYLVNANGIQKEPVKSSIGEIHTGSSTNTQGYMKANPDGTNIALALEDSQLVELFDFDNASGKVSQPIQFKLPEASYPYGIEFSPNGSVLYASAAGPGIVYQFNLQAGDQEAIRQSMTQVGASAGKEWIGALQLAPDGKIYFPVYNTAYLGVIEFPNKTGKDCGFKNNALSLGSGICQLGLPTYSQSFFDFPVESKKVEYFDEKELQTGKAIVLNHIYFEFDRYELKKESFPELEKLVGLLKNNPAFNILIRGHTDNTGNKTYNLELSANRAKSVRDFLVSKGISAEKIKFQGLGSQEPIASNDTEEGRNQNRRVEFILEK